MKKCNVHTTRLRSIKLFHAYQLLYKNGHTCKTLVRTSSLSISHSIPLSPSMKGQYLSQSGGPCATLFYLPHPFLIIWSRFLQSGGPYPILSLHAPSLNISVRILQSGGPNPILSLHTPSLNISVRILQSGGPNPILSLHAPSLNISVRIVQSAGPCASSTYISRPHYKEKNSTKWGPTPLLY